MYMTKNRLLLWKVEAVSGTEETPVVGTDAILVENPKFAPNLENIETNEVGASLDSQPDIPGGGFALMTFDVYAKGAGTAGQAPEVGPVLRCCAQSETLTAADVTGTAQAGSASTITLASGASATDDAYVGMVIGVQVGSNALQERVITDYVGSTKVATVYPDFDNNPGGTSTYTIYANALYKPVSVNQETGTGVLYQNEVDASVQSKRSRLKGSAGSYSLTVPVRGPGKFSFSMRGIVPANPDNVSVPGAATFDATRPVSFLAATARLGGVAVQFREISIDYGGVAAQPDDPEQEYGFGNTRIVNRRITGRINPLLALLSSRNAFNDFRTGTTKKLWITWGATAGNRISILLPAVAYTAAPEDGDTDGFATDVLNFKAAGFDTGIYYCVY